MSLVIKNELQELLCKFKGHRLSDETKTQILTTFPGKINTLCDRCNHNITLEKIDGDEIGYLIKNCYEEDTE
jgi:hypothetical protein